MEVSRLLLECQAILTVDTRGHTAGTLAARQGHAAIIRLLLEHEACSVNHVATHGGASMLHVAVEFAQGGVVSFLCESDADVNLQLRPGGVQPLMLASTRGLDGICRELIGYGAEVNSIDDKGRTAWLLAAGAGCVNTCQLLASFGARERVASEFDPSRAAMQMRPPAGSMTASSHSTPGGRTRVTREAEHRPAVHSAALRPQMLYNR